MTDSFTPGAFRRQVYSLLIVVSVAAACGRICNVGMYVEPWMTRAEPGQSDFKADDPRRPWSPKRPEPMPSLGANDRSRWATVRALVDHGTYELGRREYDAEGRIVRDARGKPVDKGFIFEDENGAWNTIDKVLSPDTHKFYSSKPPLLPTLAAGEYWVLKNLFGWSITADRWLVMRVLLVSINVVPLAVYLFLLSRLIDRLGGTDWARLFVMAAACFGTFLTTFATTFNNHTVAACTGLFALAAAWPILARARADQPAADSPAEAALDAAYAAAQEPTASKAPPVPAWRFVAAGFFAALTAAFELPAACFTAALLGLMLLFQAKRTVLFALPAALVPVAAFFATNYAAIGQLTPAYGEFGGPWYEYEGSYWTPKNDPKQERGIDHAAKKETRGEYILHFVFGHHGFFTLSPVFILGVVGAALGLRPRVPAEGAASADGRPGFFPLAVLTLFITIVVLAFFLIITSTRNYGGQTSGPRWLFWLSPFLLLTALPAADRLARCKWGRGLGMACLAVSVFSASYPALIPWRHPWLYQLMDWWGWLPY